MIFIETSPKLYQLQNIQVTQKVRKPKRRCTEQPDLNISFRKVGN